VTINHDLKLLRKMFAWGIRERLLTATPFKLAGENVVRLDPESPREERLTDPEAERKLFEAASPHLRGVITAMLETCCRPGEILSLQWQDVDLETREFTIRAEKAKTHRARRFPISNLGSGAEGGIRTPTLLRAPAPQAGASASSATSASEGRNKSIFQEADDDKPRRRAYADDQRAGVRGLGARNETRASPSATPRFSTRVTVVAHE